MVKFAQRDDIRLATLSLMLVLVLLGSTILSLVILPGSLAAASGGSSICNPAAAIVAPPQMVPAQTVARTTKPTSTAAPAPAPAPGKVPAPSSAPAPAPAPPPGKAPAPTSASAPVPAPAPPAVPAPIAGQSAPQPVPGVAQTVGNVKYKMELDSRTTWQTYGNKVRFTITGFDPKKDSPLPIACFRWKRLKQTGADEWWSNGLTATRVGETIGDTPDTSGIIFAVTVPRNPPRQPQEVETILLGLIPVAELKVIVAENPDNRSLGSGVHLEEVREIGITSSLVAALMAAIFIIGAGLTLYRFALFLKVPGTGVALRIISTAKGWASLAQFQIVLWTLVIGSGAVYVMALTGSLIEITKGTLILLGIAGAAAVGSQLKSSQQAQPAGTLAPPGPVTGVGVVGMPSESVVRVAWPVPTGGGPPDAYTVQFRPTGGATWFAATTSLKKPSFALVGLTPVTGYDVQVFAINAAGSGAPMAVSVATAAVTPPAAPAAVVAGLARHGNVDSTSIPLAWTGTAGATYTLQFREHNSDEAWRIYRAGIPEPSEKVTGLKASTAYDFRVLATIAAGDGPPSPVLLDTTGPRIPRWSDLVTETDRPAEIDVTRAQMLFFTIISAFFVALKIVDGGTIPEIPDTYVTLMGISNGVYLTAKFIGP
jgi:fibronectin type III domain protein